MNKLSCSFLCLFLWFIPSCDYDRFIGYDIEAQDLLETTRISGKVTNYYTDQPVFSARLKIGSLEALTNLNGQYQITYVFTADEARNKPIAVSVEATNFFPENDSILISPLGNELNFTLRYAAPIILRVARRISVIETDKEWLKYRVICQAVLMDYQGITNISQAFASFYYHEAADTLKVPLFIKSILSNNTANYQGIYEGMITFDLNYDVIAEDFDGFSDLMQRANNPFQQDELLFDSGI